MDPCPMCGDYVVPSLKSWARHLRYAHPDLRSPQPIPFPLDGPTQESSSPMTDMPATWEEALDRVLLEQRTIMIDRQNKYGPQNIIDQGLYGVLTRANADKGARVMNALQGRIVNGKVVLDPISNGGDAQDTFEDGLLDAANYYGPIAVMVLRGWWTLPRDNRLDLSPNVPVDENDKQPSGEYYVLEDADTSSPPQWLTDRPSWDNYGHLVVATEDEARMVAGTD